MSEKPTYEALEKRVRELETAVAAPGEANRELRESQRQMSVLVENLPGMAYRCLYAPGGPMQFVSPGCFALTGHTADELTAPGGIDYRDLIHPEDREVFDSSVKKALKQDRHFEIEYRIRTRSGELKYVLDQGRVAANHSCREKCLTGFVTDITGRKQREKALRKNEEIFNHFMEFSPIYVFFKDRKIRSIKLSKNYEQMLGMPLDDILGKTMDELFPPDLTESMIADDRKILNEGKQVVVEEELNGRYYTTTKFPIFIDGKPLYLAGYTMDITERRKAEDALRNSEAKLRDRNNFIQTVLDNLPIGLAVNYFDSGAAT